MPRDLIRTFVAIQIPDDVRHALTESAARLRKRLEPSRAAEKARAGATDRRSAAPKLRWTRPEGWHLTLKFLGEISADEVATVRCVAKAVAERASAFEVALGGWGMFPSGRRPRVLYIDVARGAEAIVELASNLDRSLGDAGFSLERKPYRPHVTIARMNRPIEGMGDATEGIVMDTGGFLVNGMAVIRSTLQRGGSVYEPLKVCEFGVRAARRRVSARRF